ncbi:MAG TPA: hypothetical protein VGM39_14635 [Kofleriaceae bacterium]|jgi:hypothetical protein
MGAASTALIIALALSSSVAVADSRCTGITEEESRFVTCFDLGNRLSVTAGSDGFGSAIDLRHEITFDDDPDLTWKLEHHFVETTHAAFENAFEGTVYRGRYMRHARDGHIVIPLGTPKKVFLPFDIGALTEVGTIRWKADDSPAEIDVVKFAALVDFSRTRSFRRRFVIGPVSRWDVKTGRSLDFNVDEHIVAPFTTGMLELGFESLEGRTAGHLRIEAGTAWSSLHGWVPEARAEVSLERIVLAVNDRPISLLLGANYESHPDDAGELSAHIGARITLFDKRDIRVNLRPLTASR